MQQENLPDHRAGRCRRALVLCLQVGACLALLGGTAAAPASGKRILHISTAFGPPISTPDNTGFFDLVMKEACRRIGYRVQIDKPQAERALMLANSGINDGDGPRIANLDNAWNYPYLVRVDERLFDIDFVAISRDPEIQVDDWNTLGPQYVAIVTGWKILELRLSHLSNLIKVKDVDHLLRLLKFGRTDVVIVDRYSGVATARQLGLTEFHVSEPPLASMPMYVYLNIKRADIAQEMARALRSMKEDGTYQRIVDETLSHVIGERASHGY